MLRALTITFFIGLILFKPISQFSWEVWYQVNKAYVAEELCENKAQPELNCNGKCYLMIQLKKAEIQKQSEQEQNQVNPFATKATVNWVNAPFVFTFRESELEFEQTHVFHYRSTQSNRTSIDVFHPPQSFC